MTSVVGVVPSAGVSSRMGRPKALLDADGDPFVVRAVRSLLEGGCDPVIVVVRNVEGPIAELARGAGARVIPNPDPSAGPISSIRAALDHVSDAAPGIVVLHVDHPRVRATTVAALIRAARLWPNRIILPRWGGRHGHPPLFPAALLDELRDPRLEGGARTVVHRHGERVVEVEVDDPGILQDIDDPDRYRDVFGISPAARPG